MNRWILYRVSLRVLQVAVLLGLVILVANWHEVLNMIPR